MKKFTSRKKSFTKLLIISLSSFLFLSACSTAPTSQSVGKNVATVMILGGLASAGKLKGKDDDNSSSSSKTGASIAVGGLLLHYLIAKSESNKEKIRQEKQKIERSKIKLVSNHSYRISKYNKPNAAFYEVYIESCGKKSVWYSKPYPANYGSGMFSFVYDVKRYKRVNFNCDNIKKFYSSKRTNETFILKSFTGDEYGLKNSYKKVIKRKKSGKLSFIGGVIKNAKDAWNNPSPSGYIEISVDDDNLVFSSAKLFTLTLKGDQSTGFYSVTKTYNKRTAWSDSLSFSAPFGKYKIIASGMTKKGYFSATIKNVDIFGGSSYCRLYPTENRFSCSRM